MHTGVFWPRGVNIGNRPLIEAKIKGCQRELILGERYVIFMNLIHHMCRWTLINVWNCQYHGSIILVGNQRNVTMVAYGKSIGGMYPGWVGPPLTSSWVINHIQCWPNWVPVGIPLRLINNFVSQCELVFSVNGRQPASCYYVNCLSNVFLHVYALVHDYIKSLNQRISICLVASTLWLYN